MEKLKNLFSRKFLLTLIPAMTGLLTAAGAGDSTVKIVGLTILLVSTVAYVIVEGKIDAASLAADIQTVLAGQKETEAGAETGGTESASESGGAA